MIMLENQRWIIDAVNEHKEYLDKIWFHFIQWFGRRF